MSNTAELRARQWLAEQLAWEHRLEELRHAAGIEGTDVESADLDEVARRDRTAA